MPYQTITLDLADRIATITLNRPDELNAMTDRMFTDLQKAIADVAASDARVLVLTGAGKGFCSGASLSGQSLPDVGKSVSEGLNPVIAGLAALDIPVITAVNGAAAGAGCSLALAGDIVIAGRSAFFLQAFANIGLVPDGGSSWLLPRLIGRPRAMRMMMLAERIPADLAGEWGLTSFVVDDDALPAKTAEVAARLLAGPPISYRAIRHAVDDAAHMSLTDALAAEAINQGKAAQTEDFMEGVMAFAQKRKPVFQGK